MTSVLNSFDASPLLAFTESAVFARNRPDRLPWNRGIIAIDLIDEANDVYVDGIPSSLEALMRWDSDLASFISLRNSIRGTGRDFALGVMDIPVEETQPYDFVVPDQRAGSVVAPGPLRSIRTFRFPTLPQYRQIYSNLKNLLRFPSRDDHDVLFVVDDSGSMRAAQVLGLVSVFSQELLSDGVTVFVTDTSLWETEDWVGESVRQVLARIPYAV